MIGSGGTGAVMGTGGKVGTGGVPATGGSVGSGGMVASGGTVGSGGTQGTGGAVGTDCAAIATAYETEIPNAKICTAAAGCPTAVSRSLGCNSDCITYVADATRLNEIAAKWRNNNCRTPTICPLVVCQVATSGTCSATKPALMGTCTDNSTTGI